MQPVYLFNLASRQAEWLATRQTIVAENIVNANTPGYRARDVEPFAVTLDKTELAMATTDPRHISFENSPESAALVRDPQHTGAAGKTNDVSLESELMRSSEVSRDYSLNVSVVKAFHRMWMVGVKG